MGTRIRRVVFEIRQIENARVAVWRKLNLTLMNHAGLIPVQSIGQPAENETVKTESETSHLQSTETETNNIQKRKTKFSYQTRTAINFDLCVIAQPESMVAAKHPWHK